MNINGKQAYSDSSSNLYTRIPGSNVANDVTKTQPKSAIGSGGRITADGDLHNAACTLLGIIVTAAGTAGTVDISDASGANGTSLLTIACPTNTTVFIPFPGTSFGTGVRADFTTLVGSCTAIVGPAI